jgi:hypothetical protein
MMGVLTLALRSITDFNNSDVGGEDNTDQRRGSVNMIRFGVSSATPK